MSSQRTLVPTLLALLVTAACSAPPAAPCAAFAPAAAAPPASPMPGAPAGGSAIASAPAAPTWTPSLATKPTRSFLNSDGSTLAELVVETGGSAIVFRTRQADGSRHVASIVTGVDPKDLAWLEKLGYVAQ